jgi:hypothetical protein
VPWVRGLCQDRTPSDLHRPPRTVPAFRRMLPHRPLPSKTRVADLSYVGWVLRMDAAQARPGKAEQTGD